MQDPPPTIEKLLTLIILKLIDWGSPQLCYKHFQNIFQVKVVKNNNFKLYKVSNFSCAQHNFSIRMEHPWLTNLPLFLTENLNVQKYVLLKKLGLVAPRKNLTYYINKKK